MRDSAAAPCELLPPEEQRLATQQWIFAVATWHATLAIRYSPQRSPARS